MSQWEYEIVTIKPKWSPLDLLSPRNQEHNVASILRQLHDEYIVNGWEVADQIYWERDRRFAVLKVGRPAPSLFEQVFEPQTGR